jgi:hypothetical protein
MITGAGVAVVVGATGALGVPGATGGTGDSCCGAVLDSVSLAILPILICSCSLGESLFTIVAGILNKIDELC